MIGYVQPKHEPDDVEPPYDGPLDLYEAIDALASRVLREGVVEAWGNVVEVWSEHTDDAPKIAALAVLLRRHGLEVELGGEEEDDAWLSAVGKREPDQRVLDLIESAKPDTPEWAALLLEVYRG